MAAVSPYFNIRIIAFQDCKKMRGTIRVDVEVEWRVAWEQTVIGRPILMEEEKMTKVEAIKFGTAWLGIQEKLEGCEMYEFFKMSVKALQEEPCEDCVRRQEVLDILKDEWNKFSDANDAMKESIDTIEALKLVTPKQEPRWIPVSERLPKPFSYVNCTCRSLIDDRAFWVVETCYVPQPKNSPYSDWGNIPMLNHGDCEVVAWMYREIPKPYKAESEDK